LLSRDRLRRILPAAAALLFLAGALYRFDPKLSMNGDDAEFLILGRSIAAGEGMTNINEAHPTPHTKYPFLFPAFLALLERAAPGSILLPKSAGVLLGTAAAFLFAGLLLRVASPGLAAAGSLLYATNPFFLDFGQLILSETPFLFSTLLALVLYLRWEERGARSFPAGAAAAALAAYFTRTAGIALIGALFVALLSRRRARPALLLLLIAAAAATPWVIRNQRAGGGSAYMNQFFVKDPYNPGAGALDPAHFLTKRLAGNLETYGAYEIGRGIVPAPFAGRPGRGGGSARALAVIVSLAAAGGLVSRWRRSAGLLEIYAAFYLAVCLAWPEVWGSIRFLLPVLPLLLFYALATGERLLGALPAPAGRPAAAAALLLLLGSNVYANAKERPLAEYPPAWRNYEACALWARENTPETSVFVSRKPGLFYVWSGRRSVAYLWSEDREALFSKMIEDGADYVVVAPLSATTPRYLIPAINEHRDRFEALLHLPEPDTYVLRLLPEAAR
ncbi:MAG: hypothetical protein ABIH26_00285, partial [Candidatus Eisenbacteria bacterium]